MNRLVNNGDTSLDIVKRLEEELRKKNEEIEFLKKSVRVYKEVLDDIVKENNLLRP